MVPFLDFCILPVKKKQSTFQVYLNYGEAWGEDDGGQLRMFLEGRDEVLWIWCSLKELGEGG